MAGSDGITDAIIADSAGGELGDAIHASRRKKRRRPSAFEPAYADGMCSNCGTKLIGPVCHSCGQTSETFHRPIWDLLLDVLDGLFGLEGRLWRTLPPLMFQPGKVTRRYLSGARARFVMPFRLYLTASVLFFLTVFAINSFQGDPDAPLLRLNASDTAGDVIDLVESGAFDSQLAEEGLSPEERAAITERLTRGAEAFIPSTGQGDASGDEPVDAAAGSEEFKRVIRGALLPEQMPRTEANEGGDGEPAAEDADDEIEISGLDEVPVELRERWADQADRIIDDGGASVAASMQVWAPRLMFGLLPIYALLLAMTHFYKRGYFFYDHLVVSLHFHSVLFFGFIIVFALVAVIGPFAAGAGFLLWANYYLYRLHRVVYRHGRLSSLLRTIFMDFVYSIILSLGMLALLIIGILSV